MKRRKFHQTVFVLAGIYSICWGLFTALWPEWLFQFAGMPPMNYPEIYACVGMIVGLYGLVYLEVARRPERGFLLAAIGLIGKILGPIGAATMVIQGKWTPAALVLNVGNDFIWLIPFVIYLVDSWPYYRKDIFATEDTENTERNLQG
ncbi:MAG TPA: hypothetical protein VGO50_11300 [Pyrinomonadaceae bacterium]|jgi:hypothetical protein|nr:hypothetical protein [Pyrinomonadaceae bacterium]